MSLRGGGRQTAKEEKGGISTHSLWFGKREQFIILAWLECINCLSCIKFTFYTTTLAALFLTRVKAVELMHGISVRT